MEDAGNIRRKSILLVDDEEMVANVLSRLLSIRGYNVNSYNDGLKAVKFYKENHRNVDIVLLDMKMPVISGLDTFIMMKQIYEGVKAVILSGYCEENPKILYKVGIKAFLEKPFKISKLTDTIEEVISQCYVSQSLN